MGFPIRISADRWIFAPPRSFSQLITSFIGSKCQGIHPALFLFDLPVLIAFKTGGSLAFDHSCVYLNEYLFLIRYLLKDNSSDVFFLSLNV